MIVQDSVCSELMRGCEEILPVPELEKKLQKGIPLKIKAGFDPTAPDLHLGHTVLLNKLRQFQQFGHEVIFLIGDFTAMIGDPTGKNVTRMPLSQETVLENAKTYQHQVFKILDPDKTTVAFNSQWLNKFNAVDLIRLAATHTVARMLERDDFNKRYTTGQPIAIHEFLYPLLQGYDSVALKADVELGGTDQKFNLLMGRELQKHYGFEPQVVMMTPLIEGLDGVKKMSKSLDNYIGINETSEQMFGKIMSVSDELMWRYIDLLSFKTGKEIQQLKQSVLEGKNPRDVKIDFAKEIVARFHDQTQAEFAHNKFIERFQKGNIPEDLEELSLVIAEPIALAQLLKQIDLTASTSESIRMVKQGAVKVDGDKISDPSLKLPIGKSYIIQVGKRRIAKLSIQQAH
ncbi:TPA: tyrosine--tRNA ligase [Legionella pneumophila]|uniref:Tyrosine--tRNA ligase n=1 Tax=Legionella pneumophila (strain Lens) TaxID=297245 RepID=SYY_LEGPL|nr:tyrosine--tRNA ligase [Legionella pneumophila]Q5WYX4.1 RecName: Full=Tyrosine--tRNA ligase; AltName: Full=Tyrosyl-tRNA synthetase; Short=TyrRS [Legionella pneumophila str. Lens]AOW52735.1 tyrosine--tRNA ligase [Legionella pneumophila subsp. pneumophila]AOW56364.1 tyrosine--tRNA ligase [Legionella pneumophila subsp. pneumophila]AOW58045.1 tyrosine--tRNA ligase [Legionella pneumophila subsp. pneumophila]AOW62505.1 tyrosine--tRNA ligase [Legionella pneumophila subsp. pneumophila]AOW63534.1 ty